MNDHKFGDNPFDELQIIGQSLAANLASDIRNNNGYPVYVTDSIIEAREIVLEPMLKLYSAVDIYNDKDKLQDLFKETRQPADTDSPVIFLVKKKDESIDNMIKILSSASVTTYYQDLNFDYRPILAAEQSQIKREIHEQYKRNFSTATTITDFINVINSRANTPPIPTGFSQLDKVLGGGLHEGLITIGAMTSLGKTTFCMQIADHIAKQGHDVFIFSLEMSKHELISKSISRITYEHCKAEKRSISLAKTQLGITDGNRYQYYSAEEKDLIKSAIEDYTIGIAQGLYIYESVAEMTVEQIDSIIRNHYEQTRSYPVVIIDYLQLLQHEDKYINANDKLRTDINITSLKRLSRDYKIPVIAISSFNRTSYNQEDITLSAFKESGGIEYSSDVIIGLQKIADRPIPNTELYERQIKLSVLKNRQGKKDESIEYVYNPAFNHYQESGSKGGITRTIIR